MPRLEVFQVERKVVKREIKGISSDESAESAGKMVYRRLNAPPFNITAPLTTITFGVGLLKAGEKVIDLRYGGREVW